jgi:hypothetical protein
LFVTGCRDESCRLSLCVFVPLHLHYVSGEGATGNPGEYVTASEGRAGHVKRRWLELAKPCHRRCVAPGFIARR